MRRFDRVIIADWSASSAPSPARPCADAIWLGTTSQCPDITTITEYYRTRAAAEAAIVAGINSAIQTGERLLIGFDFPMGYPQGYAERLTGRPAASAVWQWLADRITDDGNNCNNRFAVAADINQRLGGNGPFWGRPATMRLENLPMVKSVDYFRLGLAERRQVETLVPRAQPVWKLYTTGAAGSQGLMGQPMIHRLSQFPGVSVWPFDTPTSPVVLAEVYPSLLATAVAKDSAPIKDEVQVRLLSKAVYNLAQNQGLEPMLTAPNIALEEGWILGAGHATALRDALT